MNPICQRIKDERLKKGLTQQALADLIDDPKISKARIGQYECGNRVPKFRTLWDIANALDISIKQLLQSDEPEITEEDYDNFTSQYELHEQWTEVYNETGQEIADNIVSKEFSYAELYKLRKSLEKEFPEYTDTYENEYNALLDTISKILKRGPMKNAVKINDAIEKMARKKG